MVFQLCIHKAVILERSYVMWLHVYDILKVAIFRDGCQGLGMVGGGGRAGKGEANGGVCGDGSFVLRLRQRRCEPTHAINGCKPPHTRRRHQSPGFDFALRLQKFNHWGKLGEGYVEPLCIIFATFYESILIIKKKDVGTCLVVWWLRLCISTAGDTGSISGWGPKIRMLGGVSKRKKKSQEENGKEVCRMYTLSWTDNLFSGSLPHPDLVISSKIKQGFTWRRKLKKVYKWNTAKDLSRTSGSDERLKRRQGPLSDS